MMTDRILVIGALGQLGSELTVALRKEYGHSQVIAADISKKNEEIIGEGPFEIVDVLDSNQVASIVDKYNITQIYHLAALLSASGEKNPQFAWKLNMDGLFHVLDIAKEKKLQKVYWPSSIAAFGPTTPKKKTPQYTIMDPTTIYGISKLAGERLCEYYFQKHQLDIRSLRYPGLIGHNSLPGGGTTDYAVDIFYKALEKKTYECFLAKNTVLPMMYMPDAIKATLQLMDTPAKKIKIRSSYNLAAISFSPQEIANEIKKNIPSFKIKYKPDFRQKIAESWPQSINDALARKDWGWKPSFTLSRMTKDMIENLSKKTQ